MNVSENQYQMLKPSPLPISMQTADQYLFVLIQNQTGSPVKYFLPKDTNVYVNY
jgi:hypothetical protein